MNLLTFFMTGLGLIAGAVLHAIWLHRKVNASIHLPAKWPLMSRVIMTNDEYDVLRWLLATFHDHMVMVKLPVLRFTAPLDKEKNGGGEKWQDLLGGVYCSFTVCTANGNVVGCIDVPSKRGLGKANRGLKESLLSDCRIAYTVVRAASLPKGSAMRAAFLGELEVEDQVQDEATRGGDSSFHAELDSFTRQKRIAAKEAALRELNKTEEGVPKLRTLPAGFNPDGTGAFESGEPQRFPLEFEDSFTHTTDESRPAKLD